LSQDEGSRSGLGLRCLHREVCQLNHDRHRARKSCSSQAQAETTSEMSQRARHDGCPCVERNGTAVTFHIRSAEAGAQLNANTASTHQPKNTSAEIFRVQFFTEK